MRILTTLLILTSTAHAQDLAAAQAAADEIRQRFVEPDIVGFPVTFDGRWAIWDAGHGRKHWHADEMRNGMRWPYETGGPPALEYRDGFMYPLAPDASPPSGAQLDGDSESTAKPHSGVVVEYFTASWCPACRVQAPIIARLESSGVTVRRNPGGYSGAIPHTRVKVNGRIVARWTGVVQERTIRARFPDDAPDDGTPIETIRAALDLLPEPTVFADIGCGDGRVLIEAARKWNCRVVGVEIDPERARLARQRLQAAGVADCEVITGDARATDLAGVDVAFVYQFPDLLAELKPTLSGFRAFASYAHAVPGLSMQRHGDIYVWRRSERQTIGASYGGNWYTPTNFPTALTCECEMCQFLRSEWRRQGWRG